MNRILGVVAEYDPFHRGHETHLRLARERVQPDFTWVALSGCFRQRGEIAMLSPHDRAACALAAGADAVFLLPTVWTLRDAEHYALGAVSMLAGLGATHLAFGAENADLSLLRKTAECLENPSPALRGRLKDALAEGNGYPAALEKALEAESPELSGVLSGPNNILGVCYLRAILRLGLNLIPEAVERTGGYHAETVDPASPSASALRGALRRGDYARAFPAVTETGERILRNAFLEGRVPDEKILDQLLIRAWRGMSREEAAELPDVSEGIGDRILEAARTADSRAGLLDAVCTRRFPKARISRILTCGLLGLTRETAENAPLPTETLLLGLRRNPEMTAVWREGKIRVRSSPKELPNDPARSVWCQCAGLPEDWFFRRRMITDEDAG